MKNGRRKEGTNITERRQTEKEERERRVQAGYVAGNMRQKKGTNRLEGNSKGGRGRKVQVG